MYINAKIILGLPVETENGQKLGKVIDFDLDIESHIIKSYSVEGGFLGSKKLIISRSQVVLIGNEKMVVKDGVVKEEIKEKKGIIVKPKVEPALSANIIKNKI
ncbi:MAG: PRC-barrel domain-containing protein [Patescibacteria group bacterium]|nr:PRC-barrel domain-containing protein [Patescibacteria group bacterium]